jgi:long-chain acyl-CoA synthetase
MTDRNLVEMHQRQAERLGPRPALRYRRHGLFRDLTWEAYREASAAAAAALVEAGIAPGDRVGLLAENRIEWPLADLAILGAGAVNVPLHAPLTARQALFQLADAEVAWLFVSTREQCDKVREVRSDLPQLRGVVVFDRGAAAADALSWDAFAQGGRRVRPSLAAELERRTAALTGDDLATIMYTSGTTGNPKGVLLTHGNLLSNSEAILATSPYRPDDVVLNWLPLSHIYARTIDHYLPILAGVLVCLAESPETVVRDLEEVVPTHMASVPRFYEKVLSLVSADPEKARRELRRIFGPRIDWLASGGAPLPVAVAQRYHAAGLLVLQGYGLTESSPVISFNTKTAFKLDTVGRPLPGVEVRIAPDGEILTRGPHVMKGYWNNPTATAAALRDGWLYTGDLGSLDADGFLKITGRKKELLVLSNGKKVVPSQIEGLLTADPCIDQAAVYGEGHGYLTALLVPHWDNVRAALGISGDPALLAENAAVRELLERQVRAQLANVSAAEQVRRFLILARPFSVVDEELTVSLKLRREVVIARHVRQLDALYQQRG